MNPLDDFMGDMKRTLNLRTLTDLPKALTLKGFSMPLGLFAMILMLFLYSNASVFVSQEAAYYISEVMGFYMVFMFVSLIYMKKYPFPDKLQDGVITLGIWFILALSVFGILQNYPAFDPSRSMESLFRDEPLAGLIIAFTVGIAESFFFWGMIDRELSKRDVNNWRGVAPAILFFMIFHIARYSIAGVGPFIFLGAFGLFNCVLWRKTHSLIPSCGVHWAYDFWTFSGGLSVFMSIFGFGIGG